MSVLIVAFSIKVNRLVNFWFLHRRFLHYYRIFQINIYSELQVISYEQSFPFVFIYNNEWHWFTIIQGLKTLLYIIIILCERDWNSTSNNDYVLHKKSYVFRFLPACRINFRISCRQPSNNGVIFSYF